MALENSLLLSFSSQPTNPSSKFRYHKFGRQLQRLAGLMKRREFCTIQQSDEREDIYCRFKHTGMWLCETQRGCSKPEARWQPYCRVNEHGGSRSLLDRRAKFPLTSHRSVQVLVPQTFLRGWIFSLADSNSFQGDFTGFSLIYLTTTSCRLMETLRSLFCCALMFWITKKRIDHSLFIHRWGSVTASGGNRTVSELCFSHTSREPVQVSLNPRAHFHVWSWTEAVATHVCSIFRLSTE